MCRVAWGLLHLRAAAQLFLVLLQAVLLQLLGDLGLDVGELGQLGFTYVALDLAGFRSGSLNEVLPAETLVKLRSRS
mgnify:CR=1 FL=1